jgi:hypothetical protein
MTGLDPVIFLAGKKMAVSSTAMMRSSKVSLGEPFGNDSAGGATADNQEVAGLAHEPETLRCLGWNAHGV